MPFQRFDEGKRSVVSATFLKIIAAFLCDLLIASGAIGQDRSLFEGVAGSLQVEGNRYTQNVLYRPASAEYRFWDGERFNLIYQEGSGDMARRTKRALQSAWPAVDSLVGPVSSHFDTPVVISAYSDGGGGRVQVFPFRQEIGGVSNKQTLVVARSSTWPALVGPHELVHAAHLEVSAGLGLGDLVRSFSPNWARGLNALVPLGVMEGAAVYQESQIEEEAGPLHEPLFTMKMKAAVLSDEPWGITEMLGAPAYTRPYSRHYIGGGYLFKHLIQQGDTTGTEFFHEAVTWQNRLPIVGIGPWLGMGAGQLPHQIASEMQTRLQKRFSAELERQQPFADVAVVAGEPGRHHRRPYWIDEDTLVAYVEGYDVRSGFYEIDAQTGERAPIRIQTLAHDYRYSLGRDTTALYTSRYVPTPVAPDQEIAEIERVSLSSGDATMLTSHGRAVAPVEGPGSRIHAVKNNGPFTQWGLVDGDTVRAITSSEPTSLRRIAPAPGEDGPIAVLKNVNGEQLLYRAAVPETGSPKMEPWLRIEDALLYDVSWGPEGRYLLFTADHPAETTNIFALDRRAKRVLQLATVPFGAREPVLSPDRSTLAFVNYRHDQHDLVRMSFRPDSATVLPDSVVQFGGTSPPHPPRSNAAEANERSRSYAAWRHLGPKAVYPTLQGPPSEWGQYFGPEGDPLAAGVAVAGADPLRRWAYRGSAYWEDGRVWGEARVETGRFLLRPSLSVYNRAVTPSIDTTVGFEERGVGVGFRLPLLLRSNVYRTSLQMGLETRLRQTRRYAGGLAGVTPYGTRLTLNPRVGLRYRVQQNRRDLVPNTGLVVGVEGEYEPWLAQKRPGMGRRREALRTELSVYLSFLRRSHTGLRLGVGFLTQNRSTFRATPFLPRGYDALPGAPDGTFLRFEGEVVQPLWYVDDGFTLLPLYFGALSVYGFGQALGRVDGKGWQETRASVGAGLGLEVQLFYRFSLTLRVGGAYRVGPSDVRLTFR